MSVFTKAARGQYCRIRIPGICNHDVATSVFAHLRGGGWASKRSDLHGSIACSACHDAVDGRINTEYSRDELDLMHLQGMSRTIDYFLESGLLKL